MIGGTAGTPKGVVLDFSLLFPSVEKETPPTARIEDLMQEIKSRFTIVIVTHNMQQAARVSDRTAFFTTEVSVDNDRRTGVLVEFDRTNSIFSNPSDERTEAYVTGRFG